MSPSRSAAIARHEFRVMFDDPSTLVFLVGMPLLMMAFMKPLFELSLVAEGFVGANGAEQAVPGMAAMFAGFSAGFAGFSFFREHGWATWERLRASAASTVEIMTGKLLPTFVVAAVQLLGLFALGVVLFDLEISGSVVALTVVSVALSLALLSFGVAVTALSRTSQQLNAFVNVGGLVFATLGGALTPLSVMPGWVQDIAPITPTYWAMESYRTILLEAGGLDDIVGNAVVMVLFAAGFATIAVTKFRFEDSKIYWG